MTLSVGTKTNDCYSDSFHFFLSLFLLRGKNGDVSYFIISNFKDRKGIRAGHIGETLFFSQAKEEYLDDVRGSFVHLSHREPETWN